LSYQLVRQFSSSGGGVVWSEETKGSEPFYERIPDYVDHGPAKSLASVFQLPLKEKRLLALIDMPGTGKTTTVAEAARQLNAVYLHLSLKDVAMKTITRAMKTAYSGSLTGLTVRDVRENMEIVLGHRPPQRGQELPF
jgi:ATP-dependent Lon protease